MPKARVLIIDDDPMVTKLLQDHLSEEGYDVAAVHMAEEGYETATLSPPDLIFMDVMLPDATGFQMVGRLRENIATRYVPIIMMSGTARYANQQKMGKELRADEYIVKPFDVIKVGERVRQLLKTKPTVKPATEAPKPAPSRDVVKPEEPKAESVHEVAKPDQEVKPVKAAPKSEPFREIIKPEADSKPFETAPKDPFQEFVTIDRDSRLRKTAPEPEPAYSISNFDKLVPPAVQAPIIPKTIPSPSSTLGSPALLWKLTGGLLLFHMAMALATAKSNAVQSATFVAGGWVLLLGLMVAVCAALRISLDAGQAVGILGWAAIPIVLRGLAACFGLTAPALQIPSAVYWLRPLDIFEMAAITILGISIRFLPRSSLVKSIMAAVLIALAWCLTARGYFQPF